MNQLQIVPHAPFRSTPCPCFVFIISHSTLWNFVSHVEEEKKGFQTTSGKGGAFFTNTLDRVNKTEWGIINLAEFRWIQSSLFTQPAYRKPSHMRIALLFSLVAEIEIYLWFGFAKLNSSFHVSSILECFRPFHFHFPANFWPRNCQFRVSVTVRKHVLPCGNLTLHSAFGPCERPLICSHPIAISRTSMCWILSIIRFHVGLTKYERFIPQKKKAHGRRIDINRNKATWRKCGKLFFGAASAAIRHCGFNQKPYLSLVQRTTYATGVSLLIEGPFVWFLCWEPLCEKPISNQLIKWRWLIAGWLLISCVLVLNIDEIFLLRERIKP